MRIAFVTTADEELRAHDPDRGPCDAAFADRGLSLVHLPWSDPAVDWSAFDLVVIRSPWDYVDRHDEFMAWLDSMADLPTLHNPEPVIRWNLDKRYLHDLAAVGVPIVPTAFVTDPAALADAVGEVDADELVIKPTVSAGSRRTGRFARADRGAIMLGRQILASGGTVMVEPFVPSVAADGEISTVLFDGVISHAFRKGPILASGGGFVSAGYREDITAMPPGGPAAELAVTAQAAVRRLGRDRGWWPDDRPLLYARFDVVRQPDGQPVLLEAELFEPALFLPTAPGAADRFAAACAARARA